MNSYSFKTYNQEQLTCEVFVNGTSVTFKNYISDPLWLPFGGNDAEEPEASASPVPSTESIFDNIDDSEVKLDEEHTDTSSPEVTVSPEETAQVEDTPNVGITEEPVTEVTEEPLVQQ